VARRYAKIEHNLFTFALNTWENTASYRLDKDGYYRRGKIDSRYRDSYIEAYGHPPRKWHIHHIDTCKTNDHPSNLIAVPDCIHSNIHNTISKTGCIVTRGEIETLILVWKEVEDIKNIMQAKIRDINKEIKALTTRQSKIGK